MDLFNKVEEIAMINLSVLYNTNPMPLAICVLPSLVDPEQQGLSVKEELQEEEISILTRRKKNRKKVIHGVVIREVSTRMSNDNLSILKSFNLV
jgi:hypothetical protein